MAIAPVYTSPVLGIEFLGDSACWAVAVAVAVTRKAQTATLAKMLQPPAFIASLNSNATDVAGRRVEVWERLPVSLHHSS
jgi:hypothetical protein